MYVLCICPSKRFIEFQTYRVRSLIPSPIESSWTLDRSAWLEVEVNAKHKRKFI